MQVRCTCRHPSAELGRTEYETSHFEEVPLLGKCSYPQDDAGAGAVHLPQSKCGTWSYEVRNSPLWVVPLLYKLVSSRRRFHRFRDELRRSESRRAGFLSGRTGTAYAALFLSCRTGLAYAAGLRQVQRTCTIREILFADANSNFPLFGIEE